MSLHEIAVYSRRSRSDIAHFPCRIGEALLSVDCSVQAASDIFSPVSGKVLEINHKLDEEPQLVSTRVSLFVVPDAMWIT